MKRICLLCFAFCLFLLPLISCAPSVEEKPKEPERETLFLVVSEEHYDGYGNELYHKTYEYDNLGRKTLEKNSILTSTQLPQTNELVKGSAQTSYVYDEQGRLLTEKKETVALEDGSVVWTVLYEYEYAQGEKPVRYANSTRNALGEVQQAYYTLYTYDDQGREVYQELYRDWEGNDELYNSVKTEYGKDCVTWTQSGEVFPHYPTVKVYAPSLDKPTSVFVKEWRGDVLALDVTDTYTYDENGNVTECLEHFLYNYQGELCVATKRIVSQYDGEGRLSAETEYLRYPDKEEEEIFRYSREYTYGENGEVQSIVTKDSYGATTGWSMYSYVEMTVPAK